MEILRFALTGLFRKKFYSLLLLAVCFAAMQTVLSGITGAVGFFCQQKIFEASVSVELDRVLHLDYQYTEESPEFAGVIRQYLDYIGTRPGVAAVGQFDAEGVYFSELKDLEAYKSGRNMRTIPVFPGCFTQTRQCCHLSKAGSSGTLTRGTVPCRSM